MAPTNNSSYSKFNEEKYDVGDLHNVGTFDTLVELYNRVQEINEEKGYTVVKRRTRKDAKNEEERNCDVICEKGGCSNKKNPTKTRKTHTKKIGCDFKVLLTRKKKTGKWQISKKAPGNTVHSHSPNETKKKYENGGKLTEEEYKSVCHFNDCNMTRSEVVRRVTSLYPTKIFPENSITNTLYKYRHESQCEELFQKFYANNNYLCQRRDDIPGSSFIIGNKISIELFHKIPTVLGFSFFDKKNSLDKWLIHVKQLPYCHGKKYDIPLCTFVLKSNAIRELDWALKAMRQLCFKDRTPEVIITDHNPNLAAAIKLNLPEAACLFCRNSILRDLVLPGNPNSATAAQQKESISKAWNKLVSISHTEKDFCARFEEFCWRIGNIHPSITDDIKFSTWHEQYRNSFFWKVPNFNITSSCYDDANSPSLSYKWSYIERQSAYNKFQDDWDKKINDALYNYKILCPGSCEYFSGNSIRMESLRFAPLELQCFLDAHVFDELHRLHKKAQDEDKKLREEGTPISSCTGSFTQRMGIPCSHKIRDCYKYGRKLTLEDFHIHWYRTADYFGILNIERLSVITFLADGQSDVPCLIQEERMASGTVSPVTEPLVSPRQPLNNQYMTMVNNQTTTCSCCGTILDSETTICPTSTCDNSMGILDQLFSNNNNYPMEDFPLYTT